MAVEGIWTKEPDLRALHSAYELLRADPKSALAACEELVRSGSVIGLTYIGFIFEKGLGVEIDLPKAKRYYKRAYEMGAVQGVFGLGSLSWKRGDYIEAGKYFLLGAERGHARSMYWLARVYLTNTSDPNRIDKAMDLLRDASSLGHLQSTRKLGKLLMRGHCGIFGVFRGLRLYVSTAIVAANLAVDNPSSERLRDLSFIRRP